MSDIGNAPEPSQQEVAAAFGPDVAELFEQARMAQKVMATGDRLTSSLQFVPPDPEMMKITRLFLEKYDVLAEEDKKLYRGMIATFMNPPMIMNMEKK